YLLSVPVKFHDRGRRTGALNVYRRHAGGDFVPADIDRLSEAAQLLPSLYRAIRDHFGASLISEINKILHITETESAGKPLGDGEKKRVLGDVCKKVSKTFHCREVSLYLFDCRELSLFLAGRSGELIHFDLWASTLSESSLFRARHYLAEEQQGLTGWV